MHSKSFSVFLVKTLELTEKKQSISTFQFSVHS